MGQLFGLIDYDLEDFLVKESEELCDFSNDLLNVHPYLLCNGKLDGFLCHFPEQTSNGFIIAEAFCHRENIITDCTDGCIGNLGGKTGALTLAEAKILLV